MENTYHRYINLPFEITRPNITLVELPTIAHKEINNHVDENMNRFHDLLGLQVTHTEVFFTPASGGVIPIHTDWPSLDNRVKINVTWGPDDGVVRWWKIKDPSLLKNNIMHNYTDSGFTEEEHQNLLADENDCDLVYEANTNRPSLVNVGQLHSTFNPGIVGRWTLCFHIGIKDPDGFLDWDRALEYYKPFLEG